MTVISSGPRPSSAQYSALYVDDYAALRASTESSDIIVIKDTDLGGTFYRDDSAGADDDCLVIQRADGAKYVRIWDGQNFYVEWVPLAGSISSSYIRGTNAGDKLAYVCGFLPVGTTIHLKPETTYELSQRIYIDGHIIEMHGSTIQRCDEISSTVATQAEIGATSIAVADASGFRVGDRIFGIITSATVGGHAMIATHGSGGFAITSIVGNTLNFAAQPLIKQLVVGKKVVVLNTMFAPNINGEKAVFRNGIIDGNNTNNPEVLDWAAGTAVISQFLDCDNMQFYNHPNECVVIGSGSITNCQFYDCWGSAIHASNTLPTDPRGIYVNNCYGSNICTKNNAHNEGVITYSANSMHYRVENCVFDNSGGTTGTGVFGLASAVTGDQDDHFYARNVVARNYSTVINVTVSASSIPLERLTIKDSEFYDCGLLNVGTSGQTQTKSVHIKRFVCSGNKFVNCWFVLRNIHNLEWDNHCTWDFGYTGVFAGSSTTWAGMPSTRIGGASLANGDYAHLSATSGGNLFGVYLRTAGAWVYDATATAKLPNTSIPAGMTIERCGRVRLRGVFQGPAFHWRSTFGAGIYLNPVQTLVLESGSTSTSYMTDVHLDGIQVLDWNYGVVSDVATGVWAATAAQDVANWRFDNVLVQGRREVSAFGSIIIGIEVLAGCVATNCRVWLPDTATSASAHGIILKGPATNSTTVGGIAMGCYVPFCPSSSQALRFGQTGSNVRNNNCVAIGNFINKAAIQNGSGVNIDSNNIICSSATLTAMSGQTVIPWRPVGYNSGLY